MNKKINSDNSLVKKLKKYGIVMNDELINKLKMQKTIKKASMLFESSFYSKLFTQEFPVYEFIHMDKKLQKRIIDECHRIGDVQNHKINLKASMTHWEMHETNDDFMSLCHIAIKKCIEISPKPIDTTNKCHSFAPLETWGAIYTKGQNAHTHTHWPAIWSWVYNVECCNDCAPLEFNDANISIKPKIGNFILFPGWVKHSVPKQQCNHERIIVSGNVCISPFIFKGITTSSEYFAKYYKENIL